MTVGCVCSVVSTADGSWRGNVLNVTLQRAEEEEEEETEPESVC